MQSIDSIFHQLDSESFDIKKIRISVIDLIEHHLNQTKNSLGRWEKECFAGAVAALTSNIYLANQPRTMFLRFCLVSLEKIFIPPENRNENYVPHTKQLDSFTYEYFIEELKALRQLC